MHGLNNEATDEELGVVKVGAQEIQTKCISDSVPGKKQWNFDNSSANTPWLVTGYGKYGLIFCTGRIWVMEKFEIRRGNE